MILTALNGYYERVAGSEDGPPPFGCSLERVIGAVRLRPDGTFLDLIDLRIQDEKGRLRPQLMLVPQPPRRTVKVMAGFLCDNAGYVLGLDRGGRPGRAREQFDASRSLHRQLLGDLSDPAADAVLGFFDTWNPAEAAGELSEREELAAGWLVFQITGLGYAHERPALSRAWQDHLAAAETDESGQCLATGKTAAPIARLHPAIKGVPGARSSGAALVSFNLEAFTSYGHEQGSNAPVSERAAFAYGAALNHLLLPGSKRRLTIGDTLLVFWTDRDSPAESLFPELLNPTTVEQKPADRERIYETLERLTSGKQLREVWEDVDPEVRFYILGLAPNAARLSIRFWSTGSFESFLHHLRQHYLDLNLVVDFATRSPYPSAWSLARELLAKGADGRPRSSARGNDALDKLHGDLLQAVLSGTPYPVSLLPLLLERLRSDRFYSHPRIALLKALLNRKNRPGPGGREISMGLDENRKDVGYLLGRLFAALEQLQRAALGDVGATLKDKFVTSASSTPRFVFPHLMQASQAHLRKARRERPGRALRLEHTKETIVNCLTGYPDWLDIEQQGLFHIGYYHQRQAFFRKGEAEPEPVSASGDEDKD